MSFAYRATPPEPKTLWSWNLRFSLIICGRIAELIAGQIIVRPGEGNVAPKTFITHQPVTRRRKFTMAMEIPNIIRGGTAED